jgi:hypothetical protein
LDNLSRLLAAQISSDSQGSVDAGGDAGGKHPVTIQHDTFIYRNCAKEGQQVERVPVSRGAATFDQASRSADQGARADREHAAGPGGLLPYPVQDCFVLH